MRESVEYVEGYKVTVRNERWPANTWSYLIEQGNRFWKGEREYLDRNAAEEAAMRKLEEIRLLRQSSARNDGRE